MKNLFTFLKLPDDDKIETIVAQTGIVCWK